MIVRTRLGITAAFLCHLLLAPGLVTSQLLPARLPAAAAQEPQDPRSPVVEFSTRRPGEEVTIKAREQEKDGDLFKLRGDVEIEFRDILFRADEVVYDSKTGQVTATGHVVAEGGRHDERLEASRAEYNVRTQKGRFHDVVATTGARFKGRNVTLTTSSPFVMTGKLIEKVSRDRYIVHDGTVTSCELPNPKWTFNASRVVVDLGSTAKIYNSTFRVAKIPVLYFPFAAHPVDRVGRETGFLIPTFGTSSRKGTIIGESFFWAINRSLDATLGAEWFSRRGWSQHGDFRARPSENSFINFRYFGVLDRGIWDGTQVADQGGKDISLNAEARFAKGFRGVASINYLSSFVFRLAFTEGFSETVNSEVKSVAFLSNTYRGFSLNAMSARYQNFQSTVRGDVVTIVHAPGLEVSSVDRRLGRSPFYWGFDAAAEGLSRKEPGFASNDLVARLDVRPRASIPLYYKGWTLRPELAVRDTYYTQAQIPSPFGGPGTPIDHSLNRRTLEAGLEFRPPAIGRIFEKPVFGRRLKHTLETRATYRYVTGAENVPFIIRFDSRDILSNTSEIEYALVQRLYAKKTEDCSADESSNDVPPSGSAAVDRQPSTVDCSAREVLSWELAQKYFFNPDFGGSLITGRRNVFTTSVAFTGIAFLTEPRLFSPVVSRLRVHGSKNSDIEWQLDYDTITSRINASTTFVNYRIGDFFLGGSHAFLRVPGEIGGVPTPLSPPDRFNQFRVLTGYGNPSKRGFSVAANMGVDTNFDFIQYSAFQTAYNWDCCGFAVEYRRFALGSVRNENQFRFAFTLANVGTFGNLKRQERLF